MQRLQGQRPPPVILQKGDVAIVGVNANNNGCESSKSGDDKISIVFFKEFTRGSKIIFTDNGYEETTGKWGNTERYIELAYIGLAPIPVGTILHFIFPRIIGSTISVENSNPSSTLYTRWDKGLSIGSGSLNFNENGDQLFLLDDTGSWQEDPANNKYAIFTGEVLYAFNTKMQWIAPESTSTPSQNSSLHPDVVPCNYMNPSTGQSDFLLFKPDDPNLLSATNQMEWISRIKDPTNWKSYTSCATYNTANKLTFLRILDFAADIEAIPNEVCSRKKVKLKFTFSDTSGVYDVVYTDGTSNFTVSNLSSSDTITHDNAISATTTFSIVSVALSADGCPVTVDNSNNATVTVKSNTTPVFASLPTSFCEGYPVYDLPLKDDNDVAGTWTNAANTEVHNINPSTLSPGTYTYTFTSAGCADPYPYEFTVAPIPDRDYINSVNAILRDTYDICQLSDPIRGNALSLPLGELQYLLSQFDIILTSPSGVVIDLTDEFITDISDPNYFTDLVNFLALMETFVEEGTWGVQVIHENDDPLLPYNNTACSWEGTLYLNVLEDPYAGEDGTMSICSTETISTNDLFTSLKANANGNTADTGGTWSSTSTGVQINNTTGVITLPTTGSPFIFTYTVEAEDQLEDFLQSQTFCPKPQDTSEIIVTVTTPVTADNLEDQTVCTSYTLPTLTNGSYYIETGGEGTPLSAGKVITTTQTIYIYVPENGGCPSSETSFTVTIKPTPITTPIKPY